MSVWIKVITALSHSKSCPGSLPPYSILNLVLQTKPDHQDDQDNQDGQDNQDFFLDFLDSLRLFGIIWIFFMIFVRL